MGPPADNETPLAPEAVDPEIPARAELAVARTVATTGRREALLELRRQLSETDLANPGVQKMLISELDRVDADNEVLAGFRDRFHDADKQAAILGEKLQAQTAFDLVVASCFCIGGAVLGLTPSFWDGSIRGPGALVIGAALIVGPTAARVIKLGTWK